MAYSFSSSFGPLVQNNFATEQDLRNICYLLKTSDPNAAFLAYRGIIRREAERLGLTPSNAEIDEAICNIPEFLNDKGVFDPKKYDDFISMRGNQGKKLQEEILRGLMGDTMSLVRIQDVVAGRHCRGIQFCPGRGGIRKPADHGKHRLPGKERLPPQDGSR